jgi:cell division septation protein DedD
MLDILMLVLPLLGHEARHNVYHDVKGTEEELLKVVEQAIRDAHTAGVIKFQNDEMTLGEQKVKTIDLIVRLFCDWLSEVDADVVGGVLFSGPAFGANMVMSFPAMMVRDGKVSEKVKLIRTNSVFSLVPQPDGNVALVFEEHPIDYIRIYLVAAALEEIGFAKQAKELRELADFAVGDELPKEVTYKEADDQTDMVIKFATADLLAVASVMVKAIIRTPLAAQLGKSCGDLVMWNAKRQAKVDVLTDILSKGSSDLPTNQGSIFATYIGAAASQAYLKLVGQGVGAVVAAKLVNNAALKMIAGLGSLAANQCPVPSQPTTQPVATTAPTKPAPTTAPTKPAPTTAPTKPAPSTAPAKPARKTAPRRRKGN